MRDRSASLATRILIRPRERGRSRCPGRARQPRAGHGSMISVADERETDAEAEPTATTRSFVAVRPCRSVASGSNPLSGVRRKPCSRVDTGCSSVWERDESFVTDRLAASFARAVRVVHDACERRRDLLERETCACSSSAASSKRSVSTLMWSVSPAPVVAWGPASTSNRGSGASSVARSASSRRRDSARNSSVAGAACAVISRSS